MHDERRETAVPVDPGIFCQASNAAGGLWPSQTGPTPGEGLNQSTMSDDLVDSFGSGTDISSFGLDDALLNSAIAELGSEMLPIPTTSADQPGNQVRSDTLLHSK